MNKLTTILSRLAMLGMASLTVASCTTETTTPPATTTAGAPTSIMALSKNSTTVSIEWTRASDDNTPDTVIAMNGSTVASSAISGSTDTKWDVTGLTEGTAYVFSVHSTGGSSPTITWMTAERTSTVSIYETGDPSSSDPSGLVLASATNGGTQAISLSGALNADLVLGSFVDNTLPSGISLVAGNVHNVAWSDTKINGRGDYILGGLDNNYRATDYTNDMDTATLNAYDIPNDAVYNTKGSRVLIVKTADTHLALVEVVPDPSTGLLYRTNATGYKYVVVNVSYQAVVNTPYAGRPHPTHTGIVARSSAH
jgi:hypothetical protein